ncbi:MAG: invasion associated locus B family protein [Gammaproteobacteria bacterium]|nr:invasion associated locus B family protein [Gammaproteobacteria bacterium]
MNINRAFVPQPASSCTNTLTTVSDSQIGYRNLRFIAIPLLSAWLTFLHPPVLAVESGQRFNDWQVQCQENPETKQEHCFISQNLVLKEGSRQLLHVAVGFTPQQTDPVAIFTVPLGISLPPGITLSVDKSEPARLQLQHCIPKGCKALFRLDKQWLASFKAGSQALVTFHDVKRRPIGIPLSLSGFTAGIKALEEHN